MELHFHFDTFDNYRCNKSQYSLGPLHQDSKRVDNYLNRDIDQNRDR